MIESLAGVEQTLFIPLIIKAEESRRKNPILNDPGAVEIVKKLDLNPEDYRIIRYSAVASLFRSRKIDSYVAEFLGENPSGLVIEIGCGLDNRFGRTDNGKAHWINIDLPNVIRLRKSLIPENSRVKLVDTALEKISWKALTGIHNKILIIAEGVFPYFSGEYASMVLKRMANDIPDFVIGFDVVADFVVKRQNFAALKKHEVRMQWGVNNRKVIENIIPGCLIIEEWRYYDRFEPRNGLANFFRWIPFLNNLFRIYKITVKQALR